MIKIPVAKVVKAALKETVGKFFEPVSTVKIPHGYTRVTDAMSKEEKEKIDAEYLKVEKSNKEFSAY